MEGKPYLLAVSGTNNKPTQTNKKQVHLAKRGCFECKKASFLVKKPKVSRDILVHECYQLCVQLYTVLDFNFFLFLFRMTSKQWNLLRNLKSIS